MRCVAVIVLVACEHPPTSRITTADEPALGRPATRPVTAAELAAMDGFVRVVDPTAPTTAAALQPWLIDGRYRAWAREAARHPSSGPHAEAVITYLSPSLEDSLRRRAKVHPRGAAAVKELFVEDVHVGWAVGVKTAADSAEGRSWYWYEVLSRAPDARAPYQGLGVEICRDCHTESGGVDQVLTDFPLR